MTAVIKLEDIHKTYHTGEVDVHAVRGVSLEIAKGEFVAIMGASGSGKSTMMNILGCLDRPTNGRYFLDGVDVSDLSREQLADIRNQKIGFVFQGFNLLSRTSALENVELPMLYARDHLTAHTIMEKATRALQIVGLADRADHHPSQLSGGQQQRVALARSLAKKPQLLLLDEPLGALDKKLRQRSQFELVNIIESVRVTVVMVTHDQEEAMTMASRIAVMSHGRVLQVGTPKEIYECPINRFVADFIGNINLFDGQLSVDEQDRCEITTGQGVMHIAHGIGGAIGMPLTVAVRPEKIYISKVRPDVGVNLFNGKVREIAYFGSYTSFVVETAGGRNVVITEPNGSRLENIDITWEDRVFFWWDEADPVVLTQ